MPLPPCGLYRTLAPVAGVPQGRLVFFHDHGNPGPGLYLPTGWSGNRAQFAETGQTLPDEASAALLEPLAPQGLYRVTGEFFCCEKRCRRFEDGLLVQLGYDGAGRPILFVPEWIGAALSFPEKGFPLDAARLKSIAPLKVPIVERVPGEQVH